MIFAPNGVVTRETCPECGTTDVRVEHGRADGDRPCHFWHCPTCGNSVPRFVYDCEYCLAEAKPSSSVEDVDEGLRFEEEPATPGLINVILPATDSCQLLWQDGRPAGFVIDKPLFEEWFQQHRQWRRDHHHHLLGKTCRECDTPVDDRSDYCKTHNPRKRGKANDAQD